MTVTRHISMDDVHFEKMKPYIEKHEGNFLIALREIINTAGTYTMRVSSSSIDASLFDWMLGELNGVLVPDEVLDELIDPALVHSMTGLQEYVSRRFGQLGWEVDISLQYDTDVAPSKVSIELRGAPQKTSFIARLLTQFLVKNSLDHFPLAIRSVLDRNGYMKVGLLRSNKKEASRSVTTFFGEMDEMIKMVKVRPAFWKAIINRHLASNYNMVTVHRNFFEDLLADKIPTWETMIENLAKKPIHEIPLHEMLCFIKEVYETSRVADGVEIDEETILVSHSYRNKDTIEKVKKSLIMLLEANGHLYDAKLIANMIVLIHRPDVGVKINQMVGNLITSKSRVDQELIMFMAFLKGLKEIPDIPLSLTALGRRMGRSLMQVYEKENRIKEWKLETFQKALETIDSRLHRLSEWKLNGKNLLYTIRKCGIVLEGTTVDTYVCHIARETFKGAMSFAFGNRAELTIKKLVTHGDNVCEVIIRIP